MLYHFIHYCCCWMPIALILSPSLKLARKNKIIVFYLPLHTTHVCQPLDCGFFKPLKDYWRDECHKFYQKNPGLVISKYNFCGIFREAWLKAISPSNIIISGFKKAGVHPVNRNKVLLSSNNSANKQDNGNYILFVYLYNQDHNYFR